MRSSLNNARQKTPAFNSWRNMLARCTNPNNPRYSSYGARGINVCERWLSYDNFLADMGERVEGLSLNRINNDLGYSPENCEWADAKTQSRNKRNTIRCDDGVAMAVKAEQVGVSYARVYFRMKAGFDFDTATSEGKLKHRPRKPKVRRPIPEILTELMCGVPF